jgi:hypothetical protein
MQVFMLTVPVTPETTELIKSLLASNAPQDDDLAPKKRGRKPKVQEPIEDEDAEESEEDEADEADEADEEEAEEEESDEDEADEEEETEESDEDEVLSPEQLVKLKKALRAYSTKHSKAKAVKILNKYANASQDVKASEFGELMKKLKV